MNLKLISIVFLMRCWDCATCNNPIKCGECSKCLNGRVGCDKPSLAECLNPPKKKSPRGAPKERGAVPPRKARPGNAVTNSDRAAANAKYATGDKEAAKKETEKFCAPPVDDAIPTLKRLNLLNVDTDTFEDVLRMPTIEEVDGTFFWCRGFDPMQMIDKRKTATQWCETLYKDAIDQRGVNLAEKGQACLCLSILSVLTSCTLTQRCLELAFGPSLLYNGQIVEICPEAAQKIFDSHVDNVLDKGICPWAHGQSMKKTGTVAYCQKVHGAATSDDTCFVDFICPEPKTGYEAGRTLIKRPSLASRQLAKLRVGAAGTSGRMWVTTVLYASRLGRYCTVTLPAFRKGVVPINRLAEDQRVELRGRFEVLSDRHNDAESALKNSKAAKDVIYSTARGNIGVLVKQSTTKAKTIADRLFQNVFKPDAEAQALVTKLEADLHRMIREKLNASPDQLEPGHIELAFEGTLKPLDLAALRIGEEVDYQYTALPDGMPEPSASFKAEDMLEPLKGFADAMLLRLDELPKTCFTWPDNDHSYKNKWKDLLPRGRTGGDRLPLHFGSSLEGVNYP